MARRPAWIAIVALVLPLLLGVQQCGEPVADPGTSLDLELVGVFPLPTGYLLQLALRFDTDQSIQAVDVTLDWQGDPVIIRPFLDEEFDDDGLALGGPLPAVVWTSPFSMADLRHGDAAVTGDIRLAEIWVLALNGGDASVTASAVLARPDGSLVQAGSDTLNFSEAQLP